MKISHHILSEAQSIIHLSAHTETLKKRALAFQKKFEARKKEYVTPSEEEKLHHMIISYWQTRAALFDIMLEMRQFIKKWFRKKKERDIAFMVGYAATIVLVDAARFLYEHFDNIPAIRKKINEPDKQFGIPAGIYDTIQQSLNNPINAWQIDFANFYYDRKKKELLKITKSDETLAKILKIIERLGKRIKISKPEYIKTTFLIRLRQVWHWLTKSAVHRAVYSAQEGVSRIVSNIKTKPHKPHMPKRIQKKLKKLLKPGDILVTRKEFAMTNYFLPGYWPHAALYIGDIDALKKTGISRHKNVKPKWKLVRDLSRKEPRRVLESLKDGVHIRSLETPFSCDAIVIIRPQISSEHVTKSIMRGLLHESKPYDFDFDFTQSQRLVCTAVVYRSYEGIGKIKFKLTKRAGRLTLSAEDLLTMALNKQCFEPVAVYCPLKKKKIQTDKAVDRILKSTIGKKMW